jgi:hypothetical protein
MSFSVKGQIFKVDDARTFFAQVLDGQTPTSGFSPLTGTPFEAILTGAPQAQEFTVTVSALVDEADGTFSIPYFREISYIDVVALSLRLNAAQFYRTQFFSPDAFDLQPLHIFLFQPRVSTGNAITAGTISDQLQGHGLPGNSKISSGPTGISVVGSKSGAKIQFGVLPVPDTSTNLSIYLDLILSNWNIHVGWPADLCEKASDVLNKIRKGLKDASSSMNATILSNIESALESPPVNLPSALAESFLNVVSTQFTSVNILNDYTWPLKDDSDETPILFAQPAFGFPRTFPSD